MNQRTAAQAARLLNDPSRPSRDTAAAPPQPRQDPAGVVTSRLGDASCAEAHAATLRRSTDGVPAQARDSLLQLQRGYGNRFVQRVVAVAHQAPAGAVQRLVGETKDIERLRTLLDDDHEKEAIALMGTLSKDEVTKVLDNREFRELAVSAFNNDEMAQAAIAMAPKGNLYRLLEWMFDEGTDLASVHTVIRQAAGGKKEVLADGWMRDQFVSLCNNVEMAAVTKLLGGTLLERLDWMLAEGTDADLVHQAIREAPDAELAPVKNDERKVLTRLKDELWAEGFRRARQMLDGLLNWEEVKHKSTEKHYEQEDPTSPWELKEYGWTSAYEIRYSRTELRLIVRIQLTGEETTAAQRKVWSDGIANRWNGKFHLENDRRLPLVVEPVFTSDSSHVKIEIHKSGANCARENQTNWCLSTTGDTAAHELGHTLGLEDEYRLSKADYERLVGPVPAGPMPASGYTKTGLMDNGAGDVEGRHLQPYLRWLNAHRLAGEKPYRLVPGA